MRLDPACASICAKWARLDVARVEQQLARRVALGHDDAVHLEQAAHDADVADVRHVRGAHSAIRRAGRRPSPW